MLETYLESVTSLPAKSPSKFHLQLSIKAGKSQQEADMFLIQLLDMWKQKLTLQHEDKTRVPIKNDKRTKNSR